MAYIEKTGLTHGDLRSSVEALASRLDSSIFQSRLRNQKQLRGFITFGGDWGLEGLKDYDSLQIVHTEIIASQDSFAFKNMRIGFTDRTSMGFIMRLSLGGDQDKRLLSGFDMEFYDQFNQADESSAQYVDQSDYSQLHKVGQELFSINTLIRAASTPDTLNW